MLTQHRNAHSVLIRVPHEAQYFRFKLETFFVACCEKRCAGGIEIQMSSTINLSIVTQFSLTEGLWCTPLRWVSILHTFLCKPFVNHVNRPVNRAVNHCNLHVNRWIHLRKERGGVVLLFFTVYNGLHTNHNGLQPGLQDGLLVYTRFTGF